MSNRVYSLETAEALCAAAIEFPINKTAGFERLEGMRVLRRDQRLMAKCENEILIESADRSDRIGVPR